MQILDQWNDNLEPEQKTKVLRDNFITLDQAVQKTGLYLLRTVDTSAIQSIATATLTPVSAFQSAVTTNGGLVVIVLQLWISVANSTATVNLTIDGQIVKTLTAGVTGQTLAYPLTLFYAGTTVAGGHTINVNAAIAAGTLTVGSASVNSTMHILEYVKG
jgi:hypothetical protein